MYVLLVFLSAYRRVSAFVASGRHVRIALSCRYSPSRSEQERCNALGEQLHAQVMREIVLYECGC